jgi:hypothetical protein
MLQMVPLKELPDRRLQTTITPSNFPPVKNLGSYLAVAMLKKGVVVSTIQNGRPLSYSNLKESQLWKSHLFGPYGDENNPTPHQLGDEAASPDRLASAAESSGHSDVRTVDQWIKQSAAAGLADPFSPSTIPQAPPSPPHKPPPEPEIQAPPVRKRHIRVRKPLGLDSSNTDVAEPSVPDRVVSSAAPPATTNPQEGAADTSGSDMNLASIKGDSTRSNTTNSLEPNHRPIAVNGKSSSGQSEDTQSQVVHIPDLIDASPKSVDAEDAQVAPDKVILSPPPIKEPFMPEEPKASSNPDDTVFEPTWSDQVVVNSPGATLIDVAPSTGRFKERIQRQSEIDTRSVKRTMNQKRPALVAGSSNTIATLYKNFELAVTEILKVAQKAQGPLNLQMEIGRILIGPQSSSSDVKKKPFAVSEWALVFPGGRKHETLFTNA